MDPRRSVEAGRLGLDPAKVAHALRDLRGVVTVVEVAAGQRPADTDLHRVRDRTSGGVLVELRAMAGSTRGA